MLPLRLLLPLLLVNTVLAQLVTPSGGRLAGYVDWFTPLVPGEVGFSPPNTLPGAAAISDELRYWGGWHPNQGPCSLCGPILGSNDPALPVEIVYLGETGAGWTVFGYTNSGADSLLSSTLADRQFGDQLTMGLVQNESLDLFVETATGERLEVFDHTMFDGATSPYECYWGILYPGENPLPDDCPHSLIDGIPFTVIAFADHSQTGEFGEAAYFAFAFRAGYDMPAPAIPEPSTYGMAAVVALSLLVWRSRRR